MAVNSFKENYQRECVAKRERFKVEEEGKIKQYKLQGQRKLKEVVVEKIVARVEEKVKGKHSLKNKISKKTLVPGKIIVKDATSKIYAKAIYQLGQKEGG